MSDNRQGYQLGRPADEPDRNPNLVLVLNQCGQDVQAGGVLGIGGIVNAWSSGITPSNFNLFQNRLIFTGVVPMSASHSGRFVVAQKLIKSGQPGPAYIRGVCPVQVNIQSTSDGFADVDDFDITDLVSGSSGAAQLLYLATSTGVQWMWAALENGCS